MITSNHNFYPIYTFLICYLKCFEFLICVWRKKTHKRLVKVIHQNLINLMSKRIFRSKSYARSKNDLIKLLEAFRTVRIKSYCFTNQEVQIVVKSILFITDELWWLRWMGLSYTFSLVSFWYDKSGDNQMRRTLVIGVTNSNKYMKTSNRLLGSNQSWSMS